MPLLNWLCETAETLKWLRTGGNLLTPVCVASTSRFECSSFEERAFKQTPRFRVISRPWSSEMPISASTVEIINVLERP